ncbi:leukocyte tyrosine kinase receptor-like isoform X2 [Mytilus edulis]|uniref:leukocyte tyrosine kinase receptor-like isoform X2 n=1 Tax=Mytilus edulis TaxID=6550 RepID=UPI0039EE86CD
MFIKDKFKLLKGRNGGFCDRLTSSSYNASNARNSSYKVELEVGGRNGNLSIGLYYPSTRQYQEIISYINISVHWRQVEEYFEPTYEIFHLVLHACVNNNISYIGLDNIDLLQLSKDGKYTKSCSVKQFSCGDNSCISIDKICDFREDCLNGQDESNITCDSLPLGAYCNFDSPNWCGWHNVKSGDLIKDDLDWKWHTGSTPTQDTGPTEDHTTGNGHYMYMHSSGGTFLETTVLESPVFDAPNEKLGQNCQVHFHYYMYGGYVSKLVLKLVPLNDDDLKPCEEKNRVILFDKFKDQGQKWHFAAVDIKNITKRFKLHFIGYIGFSKQSDIALDDISLSPSCFGGKKDFNITVTPKCMVSEWSDWTESDLKGVSYRIGNITRSSENEKCRKHGQVQYAKVYSFGSCGYHGPTGPTQFKCDSAYKSSSVKVKVISSGTLKGTQVWTVPENGTYGISAAGGRGGTGINAPNVSGGGYVEGKFNLTEGEKIYIVVGQPGSDACSHQRNGEIKDVCHKGLPANEEEFLRRHGWGGGGGGGATFVFKYDDKDNVVPLIVAGGGGGQGYRSSGTQHKKRILNTYNTSGSNGVTTHYSSGGGGGWNGTTLYPQAGYSLLEGATGGLSCNGSFSVQTPGGFGGGGAACLSGGGGGGFTGGDASTDDDPYKSGQDGSNYFHPMIKDENVISHLSARTEAFVEINFLLNCPCDYWCNISDWEKPVFACLCPAEQVLSPDGFHCEDMHVTLQPAMMEEVFDMRYIIAIGVSVTVLFLILAAVLICRVNQQKKKQNAKLVRMELNSTPTRGYAIRTSTANGLLPSSFLHSTGIMAEYNPNYEFVVANCPEQRLNEINANNLRLVRALGNGAFGEVYKGFLSGVPDVHGELPVAVKTLPALTTEQAELDFLMEAVIMSKFQHPNIVKFIGVCFECHPRYIILELLEGGDLKTFLREMRPKSMSLKGTMTPSLTCIDLLKIAIDIAKGCQHLEDKHFIHRDIAARNCLLTCKGPNRKCKIADFGMTKDIYRSDYYKKGGKAMLPIKWMPPEAFLDGIFSTKTDVWSFGILLWEIFSMGYMPYPGRTNHDVMQYVTSGGRLEAPQQCPPVMYQLMSICWAAIPETRPTFSELIERLQRAKQMPEVINAQIPTFYQIPKLPVLSAECVEPLEDSDEEEQCNQCVRDSESKEPLLPLHEQTDENIESQFISTFNVTFNHDNLGSEASEKSLSSQTRDSDWTNQSPVLTNANIQCNVNLEED